MNARAFGVIGLLAVALAGCNNHGGLDAAAHESAGQIQRSAAIGDLVRDYQQARAAQQWDLAMSYADQLQRLAPGNALASSVQSTLVDTGVHADEAHDHQRLAGLWTYGVVDTTDDSTASIGSDDGTEAGSVAVARLVLRNHPSMGHTMGIEIAQGTFNCAPGCKVSVKFDDRPARDFAATSSDQNPQALELTDEQGIRSELDKIRVLTVQSDIDGKPRSLSFDVGGFDRVAFERRLP